MNAEEQEEKLWDDRILKMPDMSADDAKMARALKRQPDWVLQKLGIERNNISSPKIDKVGEERDVHGDQNEEKTEDGRRNGDGKNYGSRININRANHVGNNGCGINQNNGQNRGNNGNYGSDNGGGRNNSNNNGNNNGGGNNGNNGNYGNNNGIMNNQRNHHVGRQPLIIERYNQLDFIGIVGYPNQITNDSRLSIPKILGNGVDSAKQHVINVKHIIKEFEIPHEDVFMKLLVQSLIEDAGEYKTHYEILSHRPNTLQRAFKIVVTIDNNRKVVGKVAKRDDPKLYNSRVPRKDDLTQIMDMLKDLKAVEQVKSNYQLRNRNVNNEQGKPAGIFAKVTKSGGTKHNVAKGKDAGANKWTEPEKNKPIEMPKLVKLVEKKHISKPSSNYATFMSQALSQVKISMPLLEVMKFSEYKDETLKIISNIGDLNKNDVKLKEDPPDASTREKVKKKVQGQLVTHEEIKKELKSEFDESQQIVQHGLPSLVDDVGVIKDKIVWISDFKSMPSATQAIARADVLDMNDTTDQLENFYVIDNVAKDAIFNATTYKDPGCLWHIQKCG
ncbi:uncharacterized protein LOC131857562 [Cryptomeria japonica]|uniref:uncharacterized protein LOC131857562 n=1 Tax=Cryptomeria japonica TaxID=3369 RepID=UPI0027DAA6F7|nr:uncharacterized protein LOC131857562 [Cryptomeria japonica]